MIDFAIGFVLDLNFVVGFITALAYIWSDEFVKDCKDSLGTTLTTLAGILFFTFPILVGGLALDPKNTLYYFFHTTKSRLFGDRY